MVLLVNDAYVPVRRMLRTNRSSRMGAFLSPIFLGFHAKESNSSFGGVSRRVVADILS